MVKKREPKANSFINEPSPEQIDVFAAKADSTENISNKEFSLPEYGLNPDAPRSFKGIRVPFNEYEYSQLEAAVKITGRSKLNHIRYALQKLSEEITKK